MKMKKLVMNGPKESALIEVDMPVIEKDTDRDYIMTAQEAVEYGMIDKVITLDETSK